MKKVILFAVVSAFAVTTMFAQQATEAPKKDAPKAEAKKDTAKKAEKAPAKPAPTPAPAKKTEEKPK